jgi:citrate lyase beta subunit
MKTLPHALLHASDGFTPSKERLGLLVSIEAASESGAAGIFVIVDNKIETAMLRKAIASRPAGLALTGCSTGADLQRLATLLSVAEAEENQAEGSTAILAFTHGILPAPVSAEGFCGKSSRLAALVWDQTALRESLGVRTRTDDGEWAGGFAAARNAVLLTAAAAGVPAYDTAADFSEKAFTVDCRKSAGDGFFGRVAKDASQVSAIDAAYSDGG